MKVLRRTTRPIVPVLFWGLCFSSMVMILYQEFCFQMNFHTVQMSNILPGNLMSSPSLSSSSLSLSTPKLAVLFTTFSDTPEKYKLFVNTIKNWAMFMPEIQAVLFMTNQSSDLNVIAEEHGWLVVPAKMSEFGPPFLKPMYATAYTLGEAKLYGYVNGDILFDWNLIQTLRVIAKDLPNLKTTLAVGRRWEMEDDCNPENCDIWTPQQVKNYLTSNAETAKLFSWYGLDYFFVSRDFPWHKLTKDVIIGRIRFDNYILARSIEMNLATIDATQTITALHQCGHIKDRSIYLPDENLLYNERLIGKGWKYWLGQTNCTFLVTEYDVKGDVYTRKRKRRQYPTGKRQPKW